MRDAKIGAVRFIGMGAAVFAATVMIGGMPVLFLVPRGSVVDRILDVLVCALLWFVHGVVAGFVSLGVLGALRAAFRSAPISRLPEALLLVAAMGIGGGLFLLTFSMPDLHAGEYPPLSLLGRGINAAGWGLAPPLACLAGLRAQARN